MTRPWLIALCMFGVATFANADPSLKEKTERHREDEILQESIAALNKSCDTKIIATWDWESFHGKIQDGSKHVGAYCANTVEKIDRMCRTDDSNQIKPAIQKHLTEFQCAGGGGKTARLELKGKVLCMKTSLEQDTQLEPRKFLLEHL